MNEDAVREAVHVLETLLTRTRDIETADRLDIAYARDLLVGRDPALRFTAKNGGNDVGQA